MKQEVSLREITEDNITDLWSISHGPKADLEWKNWDDPYLQAPVLTWAEFKEGFGKSSLNNLMRKAIYHQDRLVGIATGYWEDGELRHWLEFGVAIYDSSLWNKGIGSISMESWITYLFNLDKEIQRIGYTTWSGNYRMMKVGEKLGMKKEAQIRKVRYWKDQYYDLIKYGVLREEWAMKQNNGGLY